MVGSDDEGMRVEELERLVTARKPKLIYLVPNFQNPKGTTLSLERRRALVRSRQRHRILILEDNPYGELRFRGEPLPSLASLDDPGRGHHLGTFSKTLAPGLRLGWVAALASELIRALTVAKQALGPAHRHAGPAGGGAAARRRFDYDGHLDPAARRVRRAVPDDARRARPAHARGHAAGRSRTAACSCGLELPRGLNADALFPLALDKRVAFVPGTSFFAGTPRSEFMRLNFSNRPPGAHRGRHAPAGRRHRRPRPALTEARRMTPPGGPPHIALVTACGLARVPSRRATPHPRARRAGGAGRARHLG